MFVVFDLDGTLACAEHRLPMLEQDPCPWDEFYRACVRDAPIYPVINTLVALRAAGAHVEIWTGRSDLVEPETRHWFNRHGVPHCHMRMRPHGNHGSDVELKRGWLYEKGPTPDLVFEDRARVVAMWREEGIRCAQVAPGEF